MAFKVYTAGLPNKAVDLVKSGVSVAFENIEIVSLKPKSDIVAIRNAQADDTVVFVCFDSVSAGEAEPFQNGLFESVKYYMYESDYELVRHLNEYFGSKLVVDEEEDLGVSTHDLEELTDYEEVHISENAELIEEGSGVYRNTSSGDDALIIHGLYEEVAQLRQALEDGDMLQAEPDQDTLDKIYELETKVDSLKSENTAHQRKVTYFEKTVQNYERSSGKLTARIEDLTTERSQRERTLTARAGQIRELENELSSLRGIKAQLDRTKAELEQANNAVESARSSLEYEESRIRAKDEEIKNLRVQADGVSTAESRLQAALAEATSLRERLSERDRDLGKAQGKIDELNAQLVGTGSLDEELESLESKVRDLERQLTSTQADLLAVTEDRNNLLSERDTFREDVNDLRNQEKLDEFKDSIYGQLGETSRPREAPASIDLGSALYKNIIFVFSGSSESETKVFQQIRGISKEFSRRGVTGLVADFSVDSFADYYLQTTPKKGLLDWLAQGGRIQDIATPIRGIDNVEFVSMVSEGFINDLYLLEVDWAKRLHELNATGYKTIAYMGSLSNLVGRVLFNSVAGRGMTRVYTMGSMFSARGVYQNLSGLNVAERTKVYFYDVYDVPKVKTIIGSVAKLGYAVSEVSRLTRGGGRM